MDDDSVTSRPKIHRLPQNTVEKSELYISRTALIVCLALFLVAVIPALWSYHKVDKSKVAETIPSAQAQLVSPTAEGKPVDTISVQDDKGEMVGQLAKMPADAEKGNSIKSMSKVDPKSGKELMNIIGKY